MPVLRRLHWTIHALGVLVAGAVLGFGIMVQGRERSSTGGEDEIELFSWDIPHGRVLYVVVDGDGVYLGDTRYDVTEAVMVIEAILEREQIRNMIVHGTDLARYGDVISVYGNVNPKLLRFSTPSLRPVPVGTRRPVTATLKPGCCGYYDVENGGDGWW